MSIILIKGAHPAKAMDNGLLDHLAISTSAFARDIALLANGSGIRFIGLGKVVNDTLKSIIKEAQSSVELTELVHPTTMSSYLCGNNGALKAAAFYDSLSILENKSFSWVGLVLQRGLWPDMSDGKGGVLCSIKTDCAIELITGVPTAVSHTSVMNSCALMQIYDDDMASDHLRYTNRTNLSKSLSLTALWLSKLGRMGGIASHATAPGQKQDVHLKTTGKGAGVVMTMTSSDSSSLASIASNATDPGWKQGVHLKRTGVGAGVDMMMSSSDRAIASHATASGQKQGVHLKRTGVGAGVDMTMSSSDCAIASHATAPGQKQDVHLKTTGKGAGVVMTMSSSDHARESHRTNARGVPGVTFSKKLKRDTMSSSECAKKGGVCGAGKPNKKGKNSSTILVLNDKGNSEKWCSETDKPMAEKLVELKVFKSYSTAINKMKALNNEALHNEGRTTQLKAGRKSKDKFVIMWHKDFPEHLDLWLTIVEEVPTNATML